MSIPRRFFRDAFGDHPLDDPLDRAAAVVTGAHGTHTFDDDPFLQLSPVVSDPARIYAIAIAQSAYAEAWNYCVSGEPERAGMFLGPTADEGLITHFVPDLTGVSTTVSFQVDSKALNRELKRARLCRLGCAGLIHSHPACGPIQPSLGDLEFLARLFSLPANSSAQQFFIPIVVGQHIYPYVYAKGRVWAAQILLV